MKRIKIIFAALVISGLSFSCSSSDDGSQTDGDLTARWNETQTIRKVSGETYTDEYTFNEAGCDKDYVEFTDGGFMARAIYYRNIDLVCTEDAATPVSWTHEDDTLVIGGAGSYSGTYLIKKLTDSELVIQTDRTVGSVTTRYIIYFSKAAM